MQKFNTKFAVPFSLTENLPMSSIIVTLPSKVKVDIQKIFNLCEDTWGSKGLMALVVYGSAANEVKYKKVKQTSRFLFWKYDSSYDVVDEPNDIDVAAIYNDTRNIEDLRCENSCSCRILELHSDVDSYSKYWVDSTRYSNLHAMCISYDCLLAKKSEDKNLQAVLEDGLIIWGDLPRPMRRRRLN